MTTKRPGIHPAQFTADLIPVMARILRPHLHRDADLFDPMAGLGWRLAKLAALLNVTPHGVEIEPGYGRHMHSCVVEGNALALPYPDGRFHAAVTSPPYPNGVSEDWAASNTPAAVRAGAVLATGRKVQTYNTYPHRLREWCGNDYQMHPENLGAYKPRSSPAAMERFYADLGRIIVELHRVLAPGAPLIWNCKDTVHEPFTARCVELLAVSGFEVVEVVRVPVRGLRQGSDGSRDRRVDTEDLVVAFTR